MNTIAQTLAAPFRSADRPSLFLLHRAWVERRRLQRLDAAALRDMGISLEERDRITVSDIVQRMQARG
ncbi:hypothetical protein HKCCE3408_07515 [Rhodobacterales bacterium HKCCE3408]|nr:hypothetical protein [Rhodobacterales bacterium HKCCE3408]